MRFSAKAITCIEVSHAAAIHSPSCGKKFVNPEKPQEGVDYFSACPHTLFVAHDVAFDYQSDRFDADVGIISIENDDIDLPGRGRAGLTSKTTIDGAVKFACYVPAPSFFGTYVGFAPQD